MFVSMEEPVSLVIYCISIRAFCIGKAARGTRAARVQSVIVSVIWRQLLLVLRSACSKQAHSSVKCNFDICRLAIRIRLHVGLLEYYDRSIGGRVFQLAQVNGHSRCRAA